MPHQETKTCLYHIRTWKDVKADYTQRKKAEGRIVVLQHVGRLDWMDAAAVGVKIGISLMLVVV